MSVLPPNYNYEHIVEALYECKGFILASLRYIDVKWGYKLTREVLNAIILENGMKEWLDDIRRSLVEDTLSTVIKKGVREGDNACLFWVLGKYKQHVDFLEPAEENKPERANGEITEFMNNLKIANADTAFKRDAANSVSTEQCSP